MVKTAITGVLPEGVWGKPSSIARFEDPMSGLTPAAYLSYDNFSSFGRLLIVLGDIR